MVVACPSQREIAFDISLAQEGARANVFGGMALEDWLATSKAEMVVTVITISYHCFLLISTILKVDNDRLQY